MNRYQFNILNLPAELLSEHLNNNGYHFSDPSRSLINNLNRFNTEDTIVNCNILTYQNGINLSHLENEKIIVPITVKQWNWQASPQQIQQVFSSFPQEFVSLLRTNSNIYLFFINDTEPLTIEYIKELCNQALRYGFSFKQLVICVSDFYIKEKLAKDNIILRDARGFRPTFLSLGNTFAYGLIAHNPETVPKIKTNRPKKFICMNRRPSPHRAALVGALKHANFLDKGFVSLRTDVYPDTLRYLTNEYSDWFREDYIYRKNIVDSLNEMKNNDELPLVFEGDVELREGYTTYEESPMWIQDHILQMHEDSYFSLVTESFMKHPSECNFMSEKVLKPILLKQPFVLFGGYRSLEVLRSMGFQTFEPWIQEEYDYKQSYFERFNLALSSATEWILSPNQRLDQMINEMEPVLEWNRQHLLNNYENFMLRTTDYKDLLKWSNFQK